MGLRNIGSSGIVVPAIGIGTAGFGAAGDKSSFHKSVRIIRSAVELGISFIDTAEAYEDGNSERVVGEAIHTIRDKVFIATKFSPQHSTPDELTKALENSLRRLETEWIDLYQMHWTNPSIPMAETMRMLEKFVDSGKIRLVGLCNASVRDAKMALSSLSAITKFGTIQNEYNLSERSSEDDVIPLCRERRITFVAHTPLCHGSILERDSRVSLIAPIADHYGITVAQLMLCWVIRDNQTLAIPRTISERHLRENAEVVDIKIDQRDLDRVSEVFKPRIVKIPPDLIEVTGDSQQDAYRTLEEAKENRFGFVPGPRELAEEILRGTSLKHIKVRCKGTPAGPKYEVLEGKMRYWAWILAYGYSVPIPAIVQD